MSAVTSVAEMEVAATRDWERVRELVAEVGDGLATRRECSHVGEFMARVEAARAALDRVVHDLQSAHLSCCVLPHLGAPDEIVLALTRLSETRVGALIVVEQETCLEEYVARGTPLDAALSASLLESLFYPGSKLHDGAVIVRADRIIAAGVFLPVVTERRDPMENRILGARHRAALALSRLTDALVLVVSEETGEVSLAVNGLLHRGVPLDGVAPVEPRLTRWDGFRRWASSLAAQWAPRRPGPPARGRERRPTKGSPLVPQRSHQ